MDAVFKYRVIVGWALLLLSVVIFALVLPKTLKRALKNNDKHISIKGKKIVIPIEIFETIKSFPVLFLFSCSIALLTYPN